MKSIVRVLLCSTLILSPVVLAHSDDDYSDHHQQEQQRYDSRYSHYDSNRHYSDHKKTKQRHLARHYKKQQYKHYKKQYRQHQSNRYSYPRSAFSFGHFGIKPYGFNQSSHHYHGFNICYSRH